MDCILNFGFWSVGSQCATGRGMGERSIYIYISARAGGLHNSGHCWWRARETAHFKPPTRKNAYWRKAHSVAIWVFRNWEKKRIRYNRSKTEHLMVDY